MFFIYCWKIHASVVLDFTCLGPYLKIHCIEQFRGHLKYVEHFSEVFKKTKAEAALAAGIFHREEVPIEAVKKHMRDEGIETR